MLADLSRSTFSNIEHQDIQFVQYSLRPSVKRFEYQLENKLFFEGESDTYHIKFDLNGLLRGDMARRAAGVRVRKRDCPFSSALSLRCPPPAYSGCGARFLAPRRRGQIADDPGDDPGARPHRGRPAGPAGAAGKFG